MYVFPPKLQVFDVERRRGPAMEGIHACVARRATVRVTLGKKSLIAACTAPADTSLLLQRLALHGALSPRICRVSRGAARTALDRIDDHVSAHERLGYPGATGIARATTGPRFTEGAERCEVRWEAPQFLPTVVPV